MFFEWLSYDRLRGEATYPQETAFGGPADFRLLPWGVGDMHNTGWDLPRILGVNTPSTGPGGCSTAGSLGQTWGMSHPRVRFILPAPFFKIGANIYNGPISQENLHLGLFLKKWEDPAIPGLPGCYCLDVTARGCFSGWGRGSSKKPLPSFMFRSRLSQSWAHGSPRGGYSGKHLGKKDGCPSVTDARSTI